LLFMSSIKLIASDLDGTLIPEGTNNLESGFVDEISRLLNRGYQFYVASGRPYMGAEPLLSEIKDRIGFICENGSLVIEKGEVTYVNEIPQNLARDVCETLLLNENVDLLISGVKEHYIHPRTTWFDDTLKEIFSNPCIKVDEYSEIPEPIIKIAMYIYDFDKNGQAMKAELTQRFGDLADFVFSGNGWLDMIMKGSGKGTALSYIMNREGLSSNEIIVFGDNENDISMFELTNNSYAKNHSKKHVQEKAGHVCDSVVKVLKNI